MVVGDAFHARGFHPTSVCGVFGATAAAARTAGPGVRDRDQRPRDRRQHGRRGCSSTSPTAPRPSGCTRAGPRTRRSSPRAWRPTGPPGRPRCSRAASGSTARSSTGTTSTSTRSPPIWASAGRPRGSRSSPTPPATTCTPRSTRPRRRSPTPRSPSTRSRRSSRSTTEAGVSLVLEPLADKHRPRVGVRGEVQPPLLGRGAAAARQGRRVDLHRRRDRRPGGARAGLEGQLRGQGVRDVPASASRRRADPRPATDRCSRPSCRISAAGPRTR